MKSVVAFALAVVLVPLGLWLSTGLGTIQVWLFGVGLVGLVGISAETLLEQPSTSGPWNQLQAFTLWIAPGLLVVAGLWLTQMTPSESQLVIAGGAGLLMAALLAGMRFGRDSGGPYARAGRFTASLILYLVTFVLFALVYQTRERSLFTATATGLVALLATLELLRSSRSGRAVPWRLALLAGLVLAETTWALNYWPVSGLVGGALLLLTFYVFNGLVVAIQEGALDRRMLLEYGSVALVGFTVIAWAVM